LPFFFLAASPGLQDLTSGFGTGLWGSWKFRDFVPARDKGGSEYRNFN